MTSRECVVIVESSTISPSNIGIHMLSNTRRATQTLWQMLYQGDMLSFLNLEPKFLDLKTYLNFIKKIRILHPLLLNVNIEHKEVFMFRRGTYSKKENFAYPKEHIENSL